MEDYPDEPYAVTGFEYRCKYLAKLHLDRWDILEALGNDPAIKKVEEFLEYEDLGLPLAWLLANGVVARTDAAKALIDDTWKNLMALTLDGDGAFDGEEQIVLPLIIQQIVMNS